MHDLSLTDYLHVLRRRLWILVLAVAITTLAAVLYSVRQPALYQTSADVLLRSQTLPSSLSGLTDPSASLYLYDPDRVMDTQIGLARLPLMANRVLAAAPQPELSAGGFLASSDAFAVPNTDFLRFQVQATDPAVATRLANEYARQYALYRTELDTEAVERSLRTLRSRIAALREAGGRVSNENAQELQQKADQLETLVALQQANAVVVRKAEGAGQIEPKPVRNGLLGLGLGLILGLGLALLREALDTRVRSTEEVASILNHVPLLARLPGPHRRLRRTDELAMMRDPNSASAEAFRMLRTNLEFASLGRQTRVIMLTSALEDEGKSTTAGNLAVALARAGKHVALVDLDLRRPTLDRYFDLQGAAGLTDVVLGRLSLDEALVPVQIGGDSLAPGENANGNRRVVAAGALAMLPAGELPPNPGDFVGSEYVRHIVGELRERADFVIVDAPPLLQVGDAMTVAGFVDGIVIVVNTDTVRRPALIELSTVLERSPTEVLGFVVRGAGAELGSYSYGYGHRHRAHARPEAELIR